MYRVTAPDGVVTERSLSADDIAESTKHRWTIVRMPDDTALFACAKNDEARAVADNAESVSDSAIDAVIGRIQAGFTKHHGAALPVTIQKVRGMDDLPPALQEAARRQQLDLGKGVFFENVVYVVQDAHGTAEEVETTIFHKLYGHPPPPACLAANGWPSRMRC